MTLEKKKSSIYQSHPQIKEGIIELQSWDIKQEVYKYKNTYLLIMKRR